MQLQPLKVARAEGGGGGGGGLKLRFYSVNKCEVPSTLSAQQETWH